MDDEQREPPGRAAAPSEPSGPGERFRRLPERIPFTQMVEEVDASAAPDPELERDANNNWLIRYGA